MVSGWGGDIIEGWGIRMEDGGWRMEDDAGLYFIGAWVWASGWIVRLVGLGGVGE